MAKDTHLPIVRWLSALVAVVLWGPSAPASARADPIPIEEEFVLMQFLQMSTLLDTIAVDLFETADVGTSGTEGTFAYASVFSILLDQIGNATTGSYLGDVTGSYGDADWTGSIGGDMTTVGDDLVFSLSGEADNSGRPRPFRYRILFGVITEPSALGNRATIRLSLSEAGGRIFRGEGKVAKAKANGIFTADGPITIAGHDETVMFKIIQATKTWEGTLTSTIENAEFKLTGRGQYDSLNMGAGRIDGSVTGSYTQSVTILPEPSTITLVGLGAIGLVSLRRRR
jgi:PEP-CTERM motif